MKLNIKRQTPAAFVDLDKPYAFKVFYGGRGGAKSWQFAEELLFQGMERPLRIMCARELQNSIDDSVHKLLNDTIKRFGLEFFYQVLNTEIRGKNGTEFIFKGLRHNPDAAKSMEGIDILWVEEAQRVSENSWEIVLPTMRKEGCQIWISFNPKYPTDPCYKLFVLNPRKNSLIKKVSWRDNPWFTSGMRDQMEHMRETDPLAYEHIWEGNFDMRFTGAVYAAYVDKRREAGSFKENLIDKSLPVHTAWDLGYDDSTAIWFWQNVGKEVRLVDFYECFGQDIEHYCGILRQRSYKYGNHYAPHDAANKLLAAGGRSIVQQAHALGVKMRVVPATSQQNGIEAARKIIESSYFDSTKCKQGIEALMAYEFPYDEERKVFKSTPKHDWSSHAADAFEIIGQVLKEKVNSDKPSRPRFLNDMTANELFWPENTHVATHERI